MNSMRENPVSNINNMSQWKFVIYDIQDNYRKYIFSMLILNKEVINTTNMMMMMN